MDESKSVEVVEEPDGKIQSEENMEKRNRAKKKGKGFWKSCWLLFCAFVFVVTGTTNTLLLKFMNECMTKSYGDTSPPAFFAKPFSQVCVCFFAMMSEGVVFGGKELFECIYRKIKPNTKEVQEKKKKKKLNELWFIIPALLDVTGSGLLSWGLLMIYASVFQMLRSSLVVFVALFSLAFFKRTVIIKLPHKILGLLSIVVGSVIVGLSSVFFLESGNSENANPLIGIILILLCQVCYCLQFCFEEIVMKKYFVSPLKLPMYEGFFGLTIMGSILIPLYFAGLESFPAFVLDLVWNYNIAIFVGMLFFSVIFFIIALNQITKHLSAAASATIDTLRNIIVWLVQMIRGKETFHYMELIGFLFIALGTFAFNEILVKYIPVYNKFVKRIKEESKDPLNNKKKKIQKTEYTKID